jgi:hypothetical protein
LGDSVYHQKAGGWRNNILVPFDWKIALDPKVPIDDGNKMILQNLESEGISIKPLIPLPLHDETEGN